MWQLFASLDEEWSVLVLTPAARAARERWSSDPVLATFPNVVAIVAALRAGGCDPFAANSILAALARRAPADDFALRTMLQALLPGLVNVTKRLAGKAVDEELEAEVLTEAVSRIRRYPLDRRPRAIAANVTLDVFGRIARDRSRRRASLDAPGMSGFRHPPLDGPDPSVEVCDLVLEALAAGRLRESEARLLLSVAVGQETMRGWAERERVSYGAMNERWRRARDRLRRAVNAADQRAG